MGLICYNAVMKPKKSFGQNFLTSTAARAAIVSAGHIQTGESILEIGPGKGFLTEALLLAGAQVTAVELDLELVSFLKEKFNTESFKQIQILHADILKYDISALPDKYKLIANIPYYITGAIIERFLSATHKPSLMVVLVQREVAERIVARDSKESILSIAVKVYGEPQIVTRVSAGSFYPKPKVDSAVLSIANINNDFFDSFTDSQRAEQLFFKILKGGFQYKRKYLISNLIKILNNMLSNETLTIDPAKTVQIQNILIQTLKDIGLDERARAENVTIEGWKHIFSAIYTLL